MALIVGLCGLFGWLSANAGAAFPGENGKIAYTADAGEIAVINQNGGGFDQITTSGEFDSSPVWSPNGRRLAFASDDAIVVCRADGSDLEEVVSAAFGENHDPGWSPDGKRLVFSSDAVDAEDDIFTVKVNGGAPKPVTASPAHDDDPTWSPDGSRIAFERSLDDGPDEIITVKPNGKGHKNVTQSDRDEDDPSYSPNSKVIVFGGSRTGANQNDISVIKANGSDRELLIETRNKNEESPLFSPDGKWIAFERESEASDDQVFKARKSGTDVKRISPVGEFAADPDWQRK
jgi:TolB protein